MRSPLNYLGGKSRLAKTIIAAIPEHNCYCEPFCGAAWVFFEKEPSPVEVLNDYDRELVTFWRVVQNHLEEFTRYFRFAVVSRHIFDLENKKDPTLLTDIQRAVRYFYIQRLAFGGKTTGRTFGVSVSRPMGLNLLAMEESLLQVHWRLARVTIEHLPARDCIQRYDRPDTLFYIDPPYYGTAGYAVPFGVKDYLELRDVLKEISGKFLLSLNDVPEVRRMFSGFRIRTVKTVYTCANGRYQEAKRDLERKELLISNSNLKGHRE